MSKYSHILLALILSFLFLTELKAVGNDNTTPAITVFVSLDASGYREIKNNETIITTERHCSIKIVTKPYLDVIWEYTRNEEAAKSPQLSDYLSTKSFSTDVPYNLRVFKTDKDGDFSNTLVLTLCDNKFELSPVNGEETSFKFNIKREKKPSSFGLSAHNTRLSILKPKKSYMIEYDRTEESLDFKRYAKEEEWGRDYYLIVKNTSSFNVKFPVKFTNEFNVDIILPEKKHMDRITTFYQSQRFDEVLLLKGETFKVRLYLDKCQEKLHVPGLYVGIVEVTNDKKRIPTGSKQSNCSAESINNALATYAKFVSLTERVIKDVVKNEMSNNVASLETLSNFDNSFQHVLSNCLKSFNAAQKKQKKQIDNRIQIMIDELPAVQQKLVKQLNNYEYQDVPSINTGDEYAESRKNPTPVKGKSEARAVFDFVFGSGDKMKEMTEGDVIQANKIVRTLVKSSCDMYYRDPLNTSILNPASTAKNIFKTFTKKYYADCEEKILNGGIYESVRNNLKDNWQKAYDERILTGKWY